MDISATNQSTIICCNCDININPNTNSISNTVIAGEGPKKYKCPGCHRIYCSAHCSQGHKIKFDCSGSRNRTPYVKLSEFDQKQFLDDYFFLETVGQRLEASKRIIIKPKSNQSVRKGSNNKHRRNSRRLRKFNKKKDETNTMNTDQGPQ